MQGKKEREQEHKYAHCHRHCRRDSRIRKDCKEVLQVLSFREFSDFKRKLAEPPNTLQSFDLFCNGDGNEHLYGTLCVLVFSERLISNGQRDRGCSGGLPPFSAVLVPPPWALPCAAAERGSRAPEASNQRRANIPRYTGGYARRASP